MARCSIEGCNQELRARGLCSNHYSIEWRKANPERARQIWSRNRVHHREEQNAAQLKRYWQAVQDDPSYREKRNAEIRKLRAQGRLPMSPETREKRRLQQQARRKQNPEKARAEKLARRAGRVDSKEYVQILMVDPCSYCGGQGGCIDHIVPVTGRGTNSWSNLTSACRRCNASKGNKPLLNFLVNSGIRTRS